MSMHKNSYVDRRGQVSFVYFQNYSCIFREIYVRTGVYLLAIYAGTTCTLTPFHIT